MISPFPRKSRAVKSAPSGSIPVTVVVPVRNEEANLASCLKRLIHFAEVVVIDSGSTDRTVEIAQHHGARVLNFVWTGRYPKKRNWYLLNHAPTQPWVLFLDADEILNDGICDEIAAAVEEPNVNGYWLIYTNYFLGRRLNHGVPQRKLALLRVGHALYERIDEVAWSALDMEIHEHPIVEGRIGELRQPIDHLDQNGIARFIQKHRDYALWEAQRFLALDRHGVASRSFTRRQVLKYRHIDKWWFPWVYFLVAYFVRLGLLDGGAGFHYAAYKAWYFQTIRLLIQEARRGVASQKQTE